MYGIWESTTSKKSSAGIREEEEECGGSAARTAGEKDTNRATEALRENTVEVIYNKSTVEDTQRRTSQDVDSQADLDVNNGITYPGAVAVRGPGYRPDQDDQTNTAVTSLEEQYEEERHHYNYEAPSAPQQDNAPVISAMLVDETAERQRENRIHELEAMLEAQEEEPEETKEAQPRLSKKKLCMAAGVCVVLLAAVAGVIVGIVVATSRSSSKTTNDTLPPTAPPSPTSPPSSTSPTIPPLQEQTNVRSWGLDRIDQMSLPLDGTYRFRYTGRGVTVFVLSVGVFSEHSEFGGRVSCGLNLIENEDCETGALSGTHGAALLGGTNYGVAKDVKIVSIKAFPSSGQGDTMNDILSGMDYIRRQKDNDPTLPMVAFLDIGGSFLQALNNAAQALVRAGIVVVVPAGNGKDPCNSSPASTEEVITVGSTTLQDTLAWFSSVGPCIDLFAPGENITSASPDSPLSTAVLSGDSMAAAYVAGVAALYLEVHPDWMPDQIWQSMQSDAASGVLADIGTGSPNLLVNTGALNGI